VERHRRFDAGVTQRLETAASGDVELIVAQRLTDAGAQGVRLTALAETLRVGRDVLGATVERLAAVIVTDDLAVAASAYAALLADVVAVLERFHDEQPFKKGLDVGTLTNELRAQPSPQILQRALRHLVEQQKLHGTHDVFSIAGYDPFARLSERERRLLADIEQAFLAAGFEPPSPRAVAGADQTMQRVYKLLLETGRLVRLRTYDRSAQIVLHADVLDGVKQAIARRFPYPEPFAAKDIRDLLHSTRKFVVPLLEHLDATGMTVRSGDLRRLREQ
jgi:selenocysteine-specific elongation factor